MLWGNLFKSQYRYVLISSESGFTGMVCSRKYIVIGVVLHVVGHLPEYADESITA